MPGGLMSVRLKLTLVFVAALVITAIVLAVAVASARDGQAYGRSGRIALAAAELGRSIVEDQMMSEPEWGTSIGDTTLTWMLSVRARGRLAGLPGFLVVMRGDSVLFASAQADGLSSNDWQKLLRGFDNLPDGGPAGVFHLSQGEAILVAVPIRGRGDDERLGRIMAGAMVVKSGWSSELLKTLWLICPLIIGGAALAIWSMVGSTMLRVGRIRTEVAAITDGRSLHRRLSADGAGPELTALIETINAMITRLENSFLALRRFTADASHELKTPLAVLRADVERAMSEKTSDADRMVALEEALDETTRMADLVDSLLTLARADEGRFQLYQEPVDLRALTQDVYETALILGEAAGVSVNLPFITDVTIQGDPARLRQLFLNLVTNAIKYTPPGGRVDIGLGRHPSTVTFAVRDTGIGIAAADLPHIFERFWRADRVRTRTAERRGVGLGLAISQWIAQAHHGTLTVSSRLGRGSLFTLTLPLDETVSVVQDGEVVAEDALSPDAPTGDVTAPLREFTET